MLRSEGASAWVMLGWALMGTEGVQSGWLEVRAPESGVRGQPQTGHPGERRGLSWARLEFVVVVVLTVEQAVLGSSRSWVRTRSEGRARPL